METADEVMQPQISCSLGLSLQEVNAGVGIYLKAQLLLLSGTELSTNIPDARDLGRQNASKFCTYAVNLRR